MLCMSFSYAKSVSMHSWNEKVSQQYGRTPATFLEAASMMTKSKCQLAMSAWISQCVFKPLSENSQMAAMSKSKIGGFKKMPNSMGSSKAVKSKKSKGKRKK